MPLVFVFIWIGSRDVGVFHMQKLVVVRMIAGIFIPYIVLDWRPFLYYLLIRHFIVVTFVGFSILLLREVGMYQHFLVLVLFARYFMSLQYS